MVENRLSDLQAENARLQALIAELLLTNQRLREDAALLQSDNEIFERRYRTPRAG